MSYFFIEYRHPEDDPTIDLRFDDDIIYTEITDGDQLDKYNTPYLVKDKDKDVAPYKSQRKTSLSTKSKSSQGSSVSIYIFFIVAVICLVLIWYFYGSSSEIKQPDIIDTYPNQPELTMMSPDMGLNSRFVRL
jgi:hypothetical protein